MSKGKTKVCYSAVPDGPKSVSVEKVKNGFVVRSYGMSGDESEFVKNLARTPTIMARILGVKGSKGPSEIDEMVEEVEEEAATA